jgi:hypothetical protein
MRACPKFVIEDGTIALAGDTALARGQTMWNVVDDQSVLALTDVHSVTYHYRDGVTWCLFSADTKPCDEPKLIGVSDINEDGRPELWGTRILKFATQIAVWDTARGYTSTFSACPGCAD